MAAFDEPWKANTAEGAMGACWGVWNADGTMKPGMSPVFNGERVDDNWSGSVQIPGGPGNPEIAFTFVPALKTFDNLRGRVLHARPSDYVVVVYIRVGLGWWVKPFSASPRTPIALDGSFTTDITTGGFDSEANTIHAFVVLKDYSPPVLLGQSEVPGELFSNSIANVSVNR
jgi:hypothetical protein